MKARGDSGIDITQTVDDKITIVGSNSNITPSCRMDGAGYSKINLTTSTTQGVVELPSTYSEYEAIDNSGDHHGGTYTIVAMNKLAVDAASGGIFFNTSGNINLMAAGGLANLSATECVTIASNVIKLLSTEITVLKGPELYVETENTVFVNTVKMAKNLIVQGGAFINGELYVNHMTTQHQIMDTSMSPVLPVYFNTPTILTGFSVQNCLNPVITPFGPLVPASNAQFNTLYMLDQFTTTRSLGRVLPHKHTYKHAACSFVKSSGDLWDDAAKIEKNEIVYAKKIENFGDLINNIKNKVEKRLTNAFIDTMTALMSNIF